MNTTSNAHLIEHIISNVFNKADWTAVDHYYAPEYIDHNPRMPHGLDGMTRYFQALYSSFPDWHGNINFIVVQDDLVATFITWSGTHQGDFQGIPPTGRQVSNKTADLFRIKDNLVIEHWDVVDLFGLLQQLQAHSPQKV